MRLDTIIIDAAGGGGGGGGGKNDPRIIGEPDTDMDDDLRFDERRLEERRLDERRLDAEERRLPDAEERRLPDERRLDAEERRLPDAEERRLEGDLERILFESRRAVLERRLPEAEAAERIRRLERRRRGDTEPTGEMGTKSQSAALNRRVDELLRGSMGAGPVGESSHNFARSSFASRWIALHRLLMLR